MISHMPEVKINNTIDPNLEKKLIPNRNGDDYERKSNSPSRDKMIKNTKRSANSTSKSDQQKAR